MRGISADFLAKHHSSSRLPVPIDEIVELELGVAVVPVEGLWRKIGMPGFISRDLAAIRVDREVFEDEKHFYRYRATLAHEAAHKLLHEDFYSQLKYSSEDGWMRVIQSISQKDFKNLEWQAESLGSLICVPRKALKQEVQKAYERVSQYNASFGKEQLIGHVSQSLTSLFQVTPSFIRHRIEQDGLLPPPVDSLPLPMPDG